MAEWLQLLIPIIGVVAAIISAALSYYFTKKNQLSIEERHLKEVYYTDFIKAVSKVVVANSSEAKDDLADKQNRMLLIGSSEVVTNLMIFHDYIKPESQKTQGFDSEIHDELLTKLIMSMRKDLYNSKKVNDKYPKIHLTGRSNK